MEKSVRIRVERLRVGLGLSMSAAAGRANTSTSLWSSLEGDGRREPKPKTMKKIASVLKCSVEYLMTGAGPSTEQQIDEELMAKILALPIEEKKRLIASRTINTIHDYADIALANAPKGTERIGVSQEGIVTYYMQDSHGDWFHQKYLDGEPLHRDLGWVDEIMDTQFLKSKRVSWWKVC